jgi:hypothetical protein
LASAVTLHKVCWHLEEVVFCFKDMGQEMEETRSWCLNSDSWKNRYLGAGF